MGLNQIPGQILQMIRTRFKTDFTESNCHARAGVHPEKPVITGFPLSRE
jgi:hypothetical protein